MLDVLLAAGLNILVGAIQTKGKQVVEEKLGVKIPDDPAKLTPELISTLKIKEYEFEEFLISSQLEDKKLDVENTKDARAMQVAALAQTDPVAKRFVYYFAWFWSLATCSYLGGVTWYPIPDDNQHYADTIIGFLLGTLIATLINFFYGGVHRQATFQRSEDRK